MSETGLQVVRRGDFPTVVDNTMRSDFIRCAEKWGRSFVENWAPAAPSIHLHAGGAFAHGLEVSRRAFYEKGYAKDEAMRQGLEAIIRFYGPIELPPARTGDKSLANVIRAYDSYMERYGLGVDPARPHMVSGKAMVEFGFTMPTEVKHPQTGEPILYGGRADMIALMHDALWVTDEKTTASLGEQWSNNWTLDSQFTGYIAAAQLFGFPVAGALIRGVGLLKTKITHAECLVHRGSWKIERWWQQLHRDLKRMVQAWESNVYDMALAKDTCNAYGGCSFVMLCDSPDPEGFLPIHFRQRKWDPTAKDSGEKLLENPRLREELTAPELHIPGLPG